MDGMNLRPYQAEAERAILSEWEDGRRRTLLVLPTGTGKTIVFSAVIADRVRAGDRVLVLAHRGELLEQAADKLQKSTSLGCAVEKAESTSFGSWYRVVVGSVQTLMRPQRLAQFPPDAFGTIVIDEAHHCLSESYQRVLAHFPDARVLGVTATPDRSDMKNLGQYFDSLAYEYTLPRAIREGYLSPIKALNIPLSLDISQVGVSAGDYKASDLGTALDPYLDSIAYEMRNYCRDRRTVVFLPLVATSRKFRDILERNGFRAAEVNGESEDRAEVIADFAAGKYDVLCNSMLLTEGWDCPAVDCVVVLRPTKSRSLYCLDEETEILTPDGWVKDAGIGDSVMVFDPETGEIRQDTVRAAIRRPLEPDEYFCSYSGPQLDVRVTNRHRMLYDNKRRLGWKFKAAEELSRLCNGAFIPVSGHGDFKGVPLSDDELRFIGWFLSDGTRNRHNNAIYISQAKHQPWLEEIEACIRGCGFKFGRREVSGGTQFNETSPRVVFSVSYGEPRGRDRHLKGWACISRYIDKEIPDALMDMTEQQFDIMLEAVHKGNGAKQSGQPWTRRSYHISTPYRKQAERLQIMGLQRGWKANIAVDTNGRDKPLYIVHMKKKDAVYIGSHGDGRPVWIREPHTDERCWCVETGTGTLITRRNGKVTIMGNCQMVGRGTRLAPGKDHLLLLDFLWHVERHELCRPASLICESAEVAQKMTENLEKSAGEPEDLEAAEKQACEDVIAEREAALAKQLAEMRRRKKRLVDPLQFEMSIAAEDLTGYVPAFGWETEPPTQKQVQALEKLGINPDDIGSAGKASKLLDRLDRRRMEGLTTPKQIRLLERYGFQRVGTWPFEAAKKLIDRIAANGWRVPLGMTPSKYAPEGEVATSKLYLWQDEQEVKWE